MDSYLLPAFLLVFSLILYVQEVMEEHPDHFRAAVYTIAIIVGFVSITLQLKDMAG